MQGLFLLTSLRETKQTLRRTIKGYLLIARQSAGFLLHTNISVLVNRCRGCFVPRNDGGGGISGIRYCTIWRLLLHRP